MELLHRLRGAFSSETPSQQTEQQVRATGDIFECEECGTTFISKPSCCSKCNQSDFQNLGSC